MYSTIRCTNGAGLQTTDVSSGVTITTDPPDHTAARITVITNPISHHPSKHSDQVYSDTLTFGWTGFVDVSDIKEYEVILIIYHLNRTAVYFFSISDVFRLLSILQNASEHASGYSQL